MSWNATKWAVEQKVKNSAQKLVLIMLADCTNGQTGRCDPSHKYLAEACCMSMSTLKEHIKALTEAGLVKIHRRFHDGQQLPNQYFLQMNAVAQMDPDNMDSDGVVSVEVVSRNSTPPANIRPPLPPKFDPPSPLNPATEPGTKPGSKPREAAVASKLSAQDLIAEGVAPEDAASWLTTRKAHRAPLTPAAWKAVKREAEKAKLTPAEAVRHAAEKGWRGFEAEWLLRDRGRNPTPSTDDIFASAR